MNLSWRLLEFALLSGFVLALSLSLLAWLLQGPLLRALHQLAPAPRARLAWWLLAGPMLAGLAYAAVTLAIPLAGGSSPALDRACSSHDASWLHACLWHPLEHGESGWLWFGVAAVALACLALLARALRALLRARGALSTLARLGRGHDGDGQVRVLESDEPLALACGLGRGQVLVSRPLVEALTPLQLRVVLAHERAHLAQGDVRWRLLARMASGLHFPGVRARLLDALRLSAEQRCDRVAAAAVGSRLAVAETILVVERLLQGRRHHAPAFSAAFAGDFVRERVEALLGLRRERRLPLGSAVALTALGFVSASAGWVHHLSEFLLMLGTS